MHRPPLVSVVIAARSGHVDDLRTTLDSVMGQSYGHVQVLVARTNDDLDAHALLLRHAHAVTVVPFETPSVPCPIPSLEAFHAFNAGLAHASGEVLVFLGHRERMATSSVLSEMAHPFADPTLDAAYGDLQYENEKAQSLALHRWTAPPLTRSAVARGWLTPLASLFVRRVWFERLGGFDMTYGPATDFQKISQLIRQPGFRALHVPRVCAIRVINR